MQVCNALTVISRRQAVSHGGTHSALLRSALLPSPASSLSRELVSGRHLPLSEAVGWPRPPYCATWRTTCRWRKRCKKTPFFTPFQKIWTNGVKSGRFLHRMARSRGCHGQASGQVLHGHLHDTDRITLRISHSNRWQYSKRFRQRVHRRRLQSFVGTAPHWFLQ